MAFLLYSNPNTPILSTIRISIKDGNVCMAIRQMWLEKRYPDCILQVFHGFHDGLFQAAGWGFFEVNAGAGIRAFAKTKVINIISDMATSVGNERTPKPGLLLGDTGFPHVILYFLAG
jgi:hypothetical protein